MTDGFYKYVIYLLLVAFIMLIAIYFVLKKRRRNDEKNKSADLIRCGSISVFFDPGMNAAMIKYGKNKFGVGKAIGVPIFLKFPYTNEVLGKTIRNAMNSCAFAKDSTDEELMSTLGFRSFKEFSQGKRNIGIHYKEGHGVVFNTTRRRIDGSYQFNCFGFEKVAEPGISDRDLGELVIELLNRCRC